MEQGALAGATIAGRYRLEAPLGRGGMAEVWRARHLTLNAMVAVKVLRNSQTDDASRRRFLAEAQITVQLKSRYAVQVFDFGVAEAGVPFLVMELLEGETLAERLARVGRLSPAAIVTFLGQAARALDRAHALGIVHRDLKPENLFVVQDDDGVEYLKVTDFGIAKFIGELEERVPAEPDEDLSRLTRTGTRLGTPYYMAPEQVEPSLEILATTDVWALGVVAFECLTGRRPFDGAGVHALFESILRGEHRSVRTIDRALPESFDAWFERACARRPTDRFASATEAARALGDALGVRDVAPPRERVTTNPPPLVAPGAYAGALDDTVEEGRATEDAGAAGTQSPLVVPARAPPRRRVLSIAVGLVAVGAAATGFGRLVSGHAAGSTGVDSASATGAAPVAPGSVAAGSASERAVVAPVEAGAAAASSTTPRASASAAPGAPRPVAAPPGPRAPTVDPGSYL